MVRVDVFHTVENWNKNTHLFSHNLRTVCLTLDVVDDDNDDDDNDDNNYDNDDNNDNDYDYDDDSDDC